MRILIVKTSSMGDVVHTLPAISDAVAMVQNLKIDWLVEESFSPIARLHPAINRVITVSVRRWRKQPLKALLSGEIRKAIHEIRKYRYDYIVDAQGLLKSAILARLARGSCYGYNKKSIREPLASYFYQHKVNVSFNEHAITRIRQLLANVLHYEMTKLPLKYGSEQVNPVRAHDAYILFIPATTWDSKHWPLQRWQQLAQLITHDGLKIKVSWGNKYEAELAQQICNNNPNVSLCAPLDISGMTQVIANASAVVAVDTGFAHLSEAFDRPMVSIYGPTSPVQHGPLGQKQIAIQGTGLPCIPCYKRTCSYRGNIDGLQPGCMASVSARLIYQKLLEKIDFRL